MTNEDLLILGRVVTKCWKNPEYRERLLSDPRDVLVEEGFMIREDVVINILEGENGLPYFTGEKEVNFPLPAAPKSQDQLEQVLENEIIEAVVGEKTYEKLNLNDQGNQRNYKVGNWMSRSKQSKQALNCCW